MSVVISESRFADSCAPQHYTPPKRQRGNVLASIALACVIGVALAGCFVIGLSS
jgi:hypothetical protein